MPLLSSTRITGVKDVLELADFERCIIYVYILAFTEYVCTCYVNVISLYKCENRAEKSSRILLPRKPPIFLSSILLSEGTIFVSKSLVLSTFPRTTSAPSGFSSSGLLRENSARKDVKDKEEDIGSLRISMLAFSALVLNDRMNRMF